MSRDSARLSPEDQFRLDALVEAAREARGEGLLVSTSGNFSLRLDAQRVAITAARCRLGRLTRDDLLIIETSSGRVTEAFSRTGPAGRPSRETPMHLAIYAAAPEVQSVLHFQSLAATAIACREDPEVDLRFIPEVPVYLRNVAVVPFHLPGSEQLAAAVAGALRSGDARVVQLCGHGQVVVGDDPYQAVERGAFFELACRLALLERTAGPLRRFSDAELLQLGSYAG